MKELKEIIGVIQRKPAKLVDFIDPALNKRSSNLYDKLYYGIASGLYKTDEEAARALYSTRSSDKRYQMLKSRLKEKMINTLLLLPTSKGDSFYQRGMYYSHRNYFIARNLLQKGARTGATSLAKSTMAYAQKFDLNDVAYLCALMLRYHSALTGNSKEFKVYDRQVIHLGKVLSHEQQMEKMFENLIIRFAQSRAINKGTVRSARYYLKRSASITRKSPSFNTRLLNLRISILYCQITRNYHRLLKICNRYDAFIRRHPTFKLASRDGEVALLKLTSCLYLRDFKQGFINAEKAQHFFKQGSNNWFIAQEFHFLIAMHAGNYKKAAQIFEEVTRHNRFVVLPAAKKEDWNISDAYLNYALPESAKRKTFRIAKFVNEVPIYSKDKEGLYVSVLIAQILFLLENREVYADLLEHKVEALRIFVSRHFTVKKSPRTVYFVKMLRILIYYGSYLPLVKNKAAKYFAQLKGTALHAQVQAELSEIIPYENLWELLLSQIKS